tara:strand:- start:115 stop:360 length:246 start_codon:yes stop_codon:yes gene_type:complete
VLKPTILTPNAFAKHLVEYQQIPSRAKLERLSANLNFYPLFFGSSSPEAFQFFCTTFCTAKLGMPIRAYQVFTKQGFSLNK